MDSIPALVSLHDGYSSDDESDGDSILSMDSQSDRNAGHEKIDPADAKETSHLVPSGIKAPLRTHCTPTMC